MKKTIIKNIILFAGLLAASCSQENIKTTDIPPPPPWQQCPDGASAGSADFTKFVAIGSSYTAGFQAGALFNDGQANSLPAILNKQFACVGASSTFNQPNINSPLGYNIFISPNPDAGNNIFGRFLLQYNGTDSPTPTPQLSGIDALPNPTYNPGFIYTGSSAALNNFAVEAITLGQFLITNTGNWADPNPAHGFSPFYARFASDGGGGTSTIIGDAASAGGSFFMFWGGMDDFMLYAAYGGDGNYAPLTTAGNFATYYGGAISTMLTDPNMKGVVVNFPEIFAMPHFTAVPWNAIPLDAATATSINGQLSDNYNAFLAGMVQAQVITQAEADARNVHYVEGQNGPLLNDETLTDLTPYMQGPYAGLQPYAIARQAKATDIFPLAAGSVLGTAVNNDPTLINGVTVPLADRYVLIPTEIVEISTARAAFNSAIAATVTNFSTKLALTDMNAAMTTFVTYKADVLNGVTVTPNIDPPTGIYSEDGLHPNTRGYAYLSTFIIKAINDKFGATIPITNIGLYGATPLPIP